ncbi:hypothetical protein IG631_10351 [Alternaria alternata]|nr:hypothetical protein IG631_10351 [Alternaria alternata]
MSSITRRPWAHIICKGRQPLEITKATKTGIQEDGALTSAGCLNCQAYVRCISESIPPSNLPANTQRCGSHQPIDTYATNSSSKYPIYTDPTLRLHKLFKFKSNLAEGKAGDEQRDYMRNAGSTMSRIFGGIKGALGNLQHVNSVGPKALNGGEVVLSADGECEYMYRMQNTVDHTNIAELAKMIGAEYIPVDGEEKKVQTCNEPVT